ncbi:MAG: hypothetical protein R3C27_11960 [Hyphomonadaceae bacterium]
MSRPVGVSEESKPTLEFGANSGFIILFVGGPQLGQVLGDVPFGPDQRGDRLGAALGIGGVVAVQVAVRPI